MKALALDTTTRAGSVALVDDAAVLEERAGDGTRSHGERLPGELLALLDAHGLALGDVDVFAVAAGPGSFTGLRIGVATVQALAFVTRRRVVPVAALEALAQLGGRDLPSGDRVAAWMDAHRRDVFAALYAIGAEPPFDPARVRAVEEPAVDAPDAILARWQQLPAPPRVVVGDGAAKYADAIARHLPSARVVDAPLLAGAIGRLAIVRARRGESVDPAAIQPIYIRRPDAEIARDPPAPPRR